ncbi:kinetochore protein SPC24 homolog [Tasmannia lanceolata]|uniref:kinetochore protein SPC24 homolog n=1 Tax=Tasmannia lanceolata TaxID=3420 RepID=UPI00406393B8
MDSSTHRIDVQELDSYGDDLVKVLKNTRDINSLMQSLEGTKTLKSSCEADFFKAQNMLQDYQKKIKACNEKIEVARTEVISDVELDHLQNELEEELQNERLLREELRAVSDEIDDLEHQRVSAEERKRILKKVDKHELRQQKKLSMYASVTNIIPDLGNQTTISGQIVERNTKVVQKFEFEPTKTPPLEICDSLWKMMDL